MDRSWSHPALARTFGLSSDVYPDLFEWIYTHPVFERWCQSAIQWQLHCIGGPGSGKTTLAALVAKHLRERYKPNGFPIVTLFVRKDVTAFETEFLEDFLLAFYYSLGEWDACSDDDSYNEYDEYYQERFVGLEGCRVNRRLMLIRKALSARLAALKGTSLVFLVVDGSECCSPALQLLLDMELCELQSKGVRIMQTSRFAVFEQFESRCDHPNHGGAPDDDPFDEDDREVLDIALTCETCDDVLCFPCEAAGRVCSSCKKNDALYEIYDHVNIRVSAPQDSVKQFIAWNLEREHGDLGLGSSARKPPSSPLGLSLRKDTNPNRANALVEEIQGLSLGHIGLTKARLDLIHEAGSVEDVLQKRYQLPANIVSMFEAGINAIEAQSHQQRDLGLKAIAAAAEVDLRGRSIPQMQQLLHRSIEVETRSGEDILKASRGFLFAPARDNPQRLCIFHESFYFYATQRYSEAIHEASLDLKSKIPRRKQSSYHGKQALMEPRVRFEPLTISTEPTEITADKLDRTSTTLETVEEAPSQPFVARKGTIAWN